MAQSRQWANQIADKKVSAYSSNLISVVNPFVPNPLFLYPLMFSGGRERVYWERMD